MFDPRAELFAPIERRHEQKIRVIIRTLGANGAVARSVSEEDCSRGAGIQLSTDPSAGPNLLLTTHAAAGNYRGVCESLKQGANPNHPSGANKDWALHMAATLTVSDEVRIVSLLVSANADKDARGESGEAPMHKAARADAAPIADFLIESGADVEALDEINWRPLHHAADYGATAAIKVMLDREENAAQVNARVFEKRPKKRIKKTNTPLDLAIDEDDGFPSQRGAAVYLLAYGGECRVQSHEWCNDGALTVLVSPFGGGGTLAAAGYDGALGVFPEVTSELGTLALDYSLKEGAEDFSFDEGSREVRAKNPLEEGDRLAVVEVSAEKGRLRPVTLLATLTVSVLSGGGHPVTASPFARGAVFTLTSQRFENLQFEKSGGAEELTISREGALSATVDLRVSTTYYLEASSTVSGVLGVLRFSVTLEAACAAGAAFGEAPAVSRSFFAAITNGDLNDACRYISRGAAVNAPIFVEQTPLHWAAVYGQSEVVSLLLDYGAEVNKVGGSGQTPLDAAVSAWGDDALPALINAGGVCLQESNQNNSKCGLRFWPHAAEVALAPGHLGDIHTIKARTGVARLGSGSEAAYAVDAEGFAVRVEGGKGILHSTRPLRESDSGEVAVLVSHGTQTITMSVSLEILSMVNLDKPVVMREAADGYQGAVAVIPNSGGATLRYQGGLDNSPFGLALPNGATGRAVFSLKSAARGPATLTAAATLHVSRAGHFPTVIAASVALTVWEPFAAASVVLASIRSDVAFYNFHVPFYRPRFEGGDAGGLFAVTGDGRVRRAPGASPTGGLAYVVTASGRGDFLGVALFTLTVSLQAQPGIDCRPGGRLPEANASQGDLDRGLREAAFRTDIPTACEHLKRGANIDGRAPYGESSNYFTGAWPLALAFHNSALSYKEKRAMFEFLLERGADPDIHAHDTAGWALIHSYAAPETELLLDYGADIEAISDWRRRTPLFEAAYWGDVAKVQVLLERGANPDGRDTAGYTALHGAAFNGIFNPHLVLDLVEVARLVLMYGANVNAQRDNGKTPIDVGSYYHRLAPLQTLFRQYGGICLISRRSICGLVMRPSSTVVNVAASHSGTVVHTVSARVIGDRNAKPVYSLVNGSGFSVDAATGELSAEAGTLTEGLLATVSIQATVPGGTQSVTVEVKVKVRSASGGGAAFSTPLPLIPEDWGATGRIGPAGGGVAGALPLVAMAAGRRTVPRADWLLPFGARSRADGSFPPPRTSFASAE